MRFAQVFISVSLTLVTFVGISQDFQPVYTNTIYLMDIIGFDTYDFEVVNSDTAILFDDVVRYELNDDNCFRASAPYFGDSLVVSTDETYFFTGGKDVLVLKHELEFGSTWHFGTIGDSIDLEAKVVSIELETLFGRELNIANIVISKSGGQGQYIGIKEMKVAEGLGIVSFYDFYHPNRKENEHNSASFSGTSRGELGQQHMGFLDAYSLPVGTVVHERGGECGPGYDECITRSVQIEVLQKDVFNDDSIHFLLDVYQVKEIYDFTTNQTEYEYWSDTITRVVYNYLNRFNRLSGEIDTAFGVERVDLYSYNSLGVRYEIGDVGDGYEGCFPVIIDGHNPFVTYPVVGSGFMGNYREEVPWDSGTNLYKPEYYKFGAEEWGTPIDVLTSSKNVELNKLEMSVYPTVSSSSFRFDFSKSDNYQIEIFSPIGELLRAYETQLSISVSVGENWPDAIYYRVSDGLGKSNSGRLLIDQ